MVDIADRVRVASKGGSRSGVVTAVSGAMITVRWDTGDETSFIPGPGVLSVVGPGLASVAKKTNVAGSNSGGTKGPIAKNAAAKRSATKGSSSSRTTGNRRR